MENINSQMKRDPDFLDKIEFGVLLLQFDEVRYYRDPDRPRLQVGETIFYPDRGLVEQQMRFGHFNWSTYFKFGVIKGVEFDYSDGK